MLQPLCLNDITILPPPTFTPKRAFEVYQEPFHRALEYVVKSQIPGDVAEFGTFHGYTARTAAEILVELQSNKVQWLFDSWEGFPEMKSLDKTCPEVTKLKTWKQGDCTPVIQNAHLLIKDILSVIRPDKIEVVKGFYSDTLKESSLGQVALLHIDCDLYTSTTDVLAYMLREGKLANGSVILFDDYNNNHASDVYGERAAVNAMFPIETKMGKRQTESEAYEIEPWFTYGSAGYAYIFKHVNYVETV